MPDKINCIIIEDELPASKILAMHISGIGFLELKGIFGNVSKALHCINTNKIDLIFLDINLPKISGIDFAKSLNTNAGIIFTTAYKEYALEGYELNAIDYLLKPVSFERFSKAVNRYMKYMHHNLLIRPEDKVIAMPFVFVKCERQMVKIFIDEILYLEAQRNCVLIYTQKTTHRTYLSITDMQEKLPESMFVRIHRSFLIAISKIEIYTGNSITIQTNIIPIGRYYNASLKKIFK